MSKRLAIIILAITCCSASWAMTPNRVELPKKVQHVSELMQKLGTGEDALVAVRLDDKKALAGHVQELGDDYAMVVDKNSGETVKVSYYKVDRLQGFNVTTGAEIHHGTGIRAKIARLALKVLPAHSMPSNSLTSNEKTLLIGIIVGVILAIVLAKVL